MSYFEVLFIYLFIYFSGVRLRSIFFPFQFDYSLFPAPLAMHSGTLAWEIPCTEMPDGLQCMGSQRVGHNLLIKQGNTLQDAIINVIFNLSFLFSFSLTEYRQLCWIWLLVLVVGCMPGCELVDVGEGFYRFFYI